MRFERDPELPFVQRLAEGRDLTLDTMRAGADVIYQAVLFDGRRLGYADFLKRVPQPSDLGDWSYEVWDTNLARHAKASAVLQLCMYSELLGGIQGRAPDEMHLALGGVRRETVSFSLSSRCRTGLSPGFHRSLPGGSCLPSTPLRIPASAPPTGLPRPNRTTRISP